MDTTVKQKKSWVTVSADDDADIQQRHSECKANGCRFHNCDIVAVIQAHYSNKLLTLQARKEAVLADILRNQQKTKHRYDPYANGKRGEKLRLKILNVDACQECYAAFYCLGPSTIRRIRVESEKDSPCNLMDKRKLNNGGNQYHSKQSLAESLIHVDDYFEDVKKQYAPPHQTAASLQNNNKKGIATEKIVLPVDVTKRQLYAEYKMYCFERHYESVTYDRVMSIWNNRHKDLVWQPKTASANTVINPVKSLNDERGAIRISAVRDECMMQYQPAML